MKATLVIDMPSKCEECPLHYRKRQGIYRCEMTHKNVDIKSKPSWCPLKPLPNKRYIKEIGWNCTEYLTESLFERGWNVCIDEITGEEE